MTTTLDNLARVDRLKLHIVDAAEIADLLAVARHNLVDAGVEATSTENRFDAACKCVTQCALVALMACGYRPDMKVNRAPNAPRMMLTM